MKVRPRIQVSSYTVANENFSSSTECSFGTWGPEERKVCFYWTCSTPPSISPLFFFNLKREFSATAAASSFSLLRLSRLPFPPLSGGAEFGRRIRRLARFESVSPPSRGKTIFFFFFYSPQLGIRVFWNRFQKTREKERKREKSFGRKEEEKKIGLRKKKKTGVEDFRRENGWGGEGGAVKYLWQTTSLFPPRDRPSDRLPRRLFSSF